MGFSSVRMLLVGYFLIIPTILSGGKHNMKRRRFLRNAAVATTILATSAFATSAHAETITVKSGDTLWKLSEQYQVSINSITEANNLNSTTLHIGQALYIPNNRHTVQAGDSLWKISQTYDTTIQAIKEENQLASTNLYIGQQLTIPTGTNDKNQSTYTVQSGDTLWIISQKFDVSIQQLKTWNNIQSSHLYVGQTLHVAATQGVNAEALIQTAKQYTGVPYQWGGTSPSEGFDCSGFLHYVFAKHNITIPRTTASIYSAGTSVSSPERGDIVYFETYKKGPSHAGIYIGNGQFIHASSSKGITISSMDNPYWSPRYLGAKSYF